ncbi:MAG: nitrous oxide-stimulated promoter family protein [Anaerolineae bacterium]|nr:nitrous oxide-stimulated promoter family protein [Anaerolineae bacterium]
MDRIEKEKMVIERMIRLYCRRRHHSRELCSECSEMLDYAHQRLDRCPFGAAKPTCRNCPIHCYKPGMRKRINAVMKYSGPRMLFRYPALAIDHLIHGLKKAS